MNSTSLFPVVLLTWATVVGCQTATAKQFSETEQPQNHTTILVGDQGFFPLSQKDHDFLVFFLKFDDSDQVQSWEVRWTDEAGHTVYQTSGVPPTLPEALTWDDRDFNGDRAPSGTYTAVFRVQYLAPKAQEKTETLPFSLDSTPGSPGDAFSFPVADFENASDALE